MSGRARWAGRLTRRAGLIHVARGAIGFGAGRPGPYDLSGPPGTVGEAPAAAAAAAAGVVAATNAARAAAGVGAVRAEARLTAAAQTYATAMAASGCFAHNCPPQPDAARRVAGAGYADWAWMAENLAYGQPTPEAAVTAWLDSPPHRANLLDARPTEVGVGHAAGGPQRTLWVQLLAAPLPPPLPPEAAAERVLVRLDAARAGAGAAALQRDAALTRAAQEYAAVLAAGSCFGFACAAPAGAPGGAGGDTLRARVERAGYSGWTQLAEAVATGQPDPEAAADAVLAQGPAAFDPAYTAAGAAAAAGGRNGRTAWVVVLGAAGVLEEPA